jgi:hypothetical protein
MLRLTALFLLSVAVLAAEDFTGWWKNFQRAVAKSDGNASSEGTEFPMDWELGHVRKIEARAAFVDRFDNYFPDDMKKAIATKKPERLPNGTYIITWKARGNEYSLYFKPTGAKFALSALSEGPP